MAARYTLPKSTPTRVPLPDSRLTWKTHLLKYLLRTRTEPYPTQAQLDEFIGFLSKGDPLADGVVAMFKEVGHKKGRELVDRAANLGIDNVPDAPPALRAFFEQVEYVPLWVDVERMNRGCDVHRRVGAAAELVLRNVSLMGGYVASAATKPLAFTAQLDKATSRRLVETGKYWADVTTRDNLLPFTDGWRTSIHVRLMHAQVRGMLTQSPRWDHEAWGLPINQADTVATNLLFSYIYLHALRALGFRFTRDERESVIHLWRYAGYLMGVDDKLLPADEDDAARVAFLNYLTLAEPDEDSRRLAQSLMNASNTLAEQAPWLPSWAKRMEYGFRGSYSRLMLGKKTADYLGLPDTPMKFAVLGTVPLVFGLETLRRSVPGATWAMTRIGERMIKVGMEQQTMIHHPDITFTPVEQLAR